ncbi:MAG: effector binding domain-containing protein [Pseudomonadota bacterium]
MRIVHQEQAIHVIGIELRTSNDEAFRSIPQHWERFSRERVLEQLPPQPAPEVYAVYTHFENAGRDNRGVYSLVIGAPAAPGTPLPPGMVRAVAPASRCAAFDVPAGRHDLVGAAWQEIWARTDLDRTFVADYEHYRPDGGIEILVGLREARG